MKMNYFQIKTQFLLDLQFKISNLTHKHKKKRDKEMKKILVRLSNFRK